MNTASGCILVFLAVIVIAMCSGCQTCNVALLSNNNILTTRSATAANGNANPTVSGGGQTDANLSLTPK